MTFRNVIFTINNYDHLLGWDPEKMVYLIYQEEIGQSGTPHLQGYVELKKQWRLAALKTYLGGDHVHIERRMGTQQEAVTYNSKEDTRKVGTSPYEYGEKRTQGKRSDILTLRDAVYAGKRKRDIIADDELAVVHCKYHRWYNDIVSQTRPERVGQLKVILHVGKTGTGKTRYVEDKHLKDKEYWVAPVSNGTVWFDNYDGHQTVLIDDFAGAASHMTLSMLLNILDRYVRQVPTKGGHVWWYPSTIYITTNIHPIKWYKWEDRQEQYLALERRFTEVKVFTLEGDPELQGKTWWDNPVEALVAPSDFPEINGY